MITGKHEKLLNKLLAGTSDTNIKFKQLTQLLLALGFSRRIKGSHQIFYHDQIPEIINIQDQNGMAKSYQVKQIRDIVIRRNITIK